jgi:DNA gyrase/topoisomerase IV subunit A
MITPEKINEWLKEVEQRPSSAPLIIQFLANRLRELSGRNEELLSENIALLTGKRVEEYLQRITHLEYQLELLKRQLSGEQSEVALSDVAATQVSITTPPVIQPASLLIYNTLGQVLRLEIPLSPSTCEPWIILSNPLSPALEPPRIIGVPATEELLFVFTSGRISTLPLTSLPVAASSPILSWSQASLPDEPRATETLACLAPVSRLALADSFLQVTRRGFVKKISISLAPSILANHFIGTGIKQPADRTFEIALGKKDDRLVLVSAEGYLLLLNAHSLPTAIDEAMRMGNTDHLVAAFILTPDHSLLVATQIGKLIHRTEDSLEVTSSFKTKGQAILSPSRREQGVRVIGAAVSREDEWAAALHRDGSLTLHPMRDLFSSGVIPTQSELVSLAVF